MVQIGRKSLPRPGHSKGGSRKFLTHLRRRRRLVRPRPLTQTPRVRPQSMGPDHITTGEALYTVSLVYVYARDRGRALQLLRKARAPPPPFSY